MIKYLFKKYSSLTKALTNSLYFHVNNHNFKNKTKLEKTLIGLALNFYSLNELSLPPSIGSNRLHNSSCTTRYYVRRKSTTSRISEIRENNCIA